MAIEQVSEERKQEILRRFSQAVATYKPKVEDLLTDLTGNPISFGRVRVKDMSKYVEDLRKNAWRSERNILDMAEVFFGSNVFYRDDYRQKAKKHVELMSQGSLLLTAFYNNCLYVDSTQNPYDLGNEYPKIEHRCAHEFFHGGWGILRGQDPFNLPLSEEEVRDFLILYEGWATYLEYIEALEHNKKFYPEPIIISIGVQLDNSPDNLYTQGRRKIEELVAQHEKRVLADIPRNWRKYVDK
jgi:hypothetical protein